ncbi:hypothetical protein Tco_0226505 [Tanacetum coccineum]
MEAHCVNLELKYQNQALKFRQHGQILNETSNKAKIKMEKDVLETINIELEHSVAKLLTEIEQLNKENEHLKQTYKDLYDSIKKTRFYKLRNQSVVRQPNAFQSERPKFSKPRFASQVDVNNDLPKPVTPHYLPKVRESVFVKPHHVIASGLSRYSSKESYGSNDMAHNYYLEEAKKKTQDKNTNLKPRKMPYARTHHTPNACTPTLRSNNQMSRNWPTSKSSDVTLKAVQKAYYSRNPSLFSESKHFVCSTCHKCIFNANHDACVTKFLKEVPTRKIFTSSTTKVDSEPPSGSNEEITNPYEYEQTLNVSVCTLNLSEGTSFNPKKERLKVWNDWDTLFQPFFNEYSNPPPSVDHLVPEVAAPEPANLTNTPSSTSIDQDAPSPSTSQTHQESQSPAIPPSVKEEFHDIKVAHLDNDPFFGLLIPEPS